MTGRSRPPGRARRPRIPEVIREHALRLHFGRGLSLRQTREAMAERGLDLSHEALRTWIKAAQAGGETPDAEPPRPARWTLEAEIALIHGGAAHLWLARGPDGAVLELVVQRTRDRRAAHRDLRRLLDRAPPGSSPP